jgi:hypothetical protein
MKKTLLFVSILISSFSQAQSLTLANEYAIGEFSDMHLVDSFANNLDAVTGIGVTWDYSDLLGYPGEARLVEVLDATTQPDYSSFPGSTKAIKIGSSITTYFTSDATSRTSQGFKFTEPTLGDVYATFSSDPLTMVTYDFGYGSSLTDSYAGNIDFSYNGFPVNEALTGEAYAWVDGTGTMLFPGGVSVSNVIRYKSIDTSLTTVPLLGAVELIREQYEYYDLATQNLPIFIHSNVVMRPPGGSALADLSIVLSKYEANYTAVGSIQNNDFTVSPNPTLNGIKINGEFTSDANGEIKDASGKTVKSFNVLNGMNIDLSSLEQGVYFLHVSSNGISTIKSIVKL